MYVPTTLKVIIRPDKPNAKGLAPILLRFTQNRKKHTIALKKRVKPENWTNANGMYVRESGKDAPRNGKVINVFIRSFVARAENILLEAQMQNQSVSFSEFKAKIVNSKLSSSEKHRIYTELSKIMKKQDLEGYKKIYHSL